MGSSFDIIRLYSIAIIALVLLIFVGPIAKSAIERQMASIKSPLAEVNKNGITASNNFGAVTNSGDTDVAPATPVTPSTPSQTVTPKPSATDPVIESAKNFYSIGLPVVMASYEIRNGPIQPNEASWNAFISRYPNQIDPQTGKPPKFTSTTPKVGEVQYVYPARCVSALEFGEDKKSSAFKTLIGGKRACVSNIYKYIED